MAFSQNFLLLGIVLLSIINQISCDLHPPLNHLMENENEGESNEETQQENLGDLDLKRNPLDHMIKAYNKTSVKKYKCYSCEPPDCKEDPPCSNALQCWKSRERDSDGQERVSRGCTLAEDQAPLYCSTQHHRHTKRHGGGGQYAIECCTGDFCNNGSFPLLPLVIYQGEASNEPEWSNTYIVKGMLYIPYAELSEPFAAWFDSNMGSSRIDYYGGMVKTYQLSSKEQFGISRKVSPMTTETELNAIKCFQVNGTQKDKINIQSVLPDLTGFQMVGEEMINGLLTDKWRKIDNKGEKVNKYTMYLRWKKSPKAPKVQIPIPVRYEMKGYNSLLGSHYDHYYLNYEEFGWDTPSPDVFDINPQMECGSFPGPGADHIYNFNPMAEFVDSASHHVDSAWEQYQRIHNKEYKPDQLTQRMDNFRQNMRLIASHNRANVGYTLAVNHLADRTTDELKVLRGRKYSPGYNGGQPFPYDTKTLANTLPDQFDWRIYGAVTPVKDQSVCGSCWSFGTAGHIEGAYFVKTGHLVRLSQQALVDCSWGEGNNGCDGGEDFRAYQWMMKHGGLPLEADYGNYLGQNGYCHINGTPTVAAITGYVNVTSNDPEALKVALLKHGPISVAIDASKPTFTFYANGIYNEKDCRNDPDGLDHAVLLVGYGKIGDRDYWLIKNSWSNYWGNDGYVLMDPVNNNCGVMTTPTYVLM